MISLDYYFEIIASVEYAAVIVADTRPELRNRLLLLIGVEAAYFGASLL